MKKYARKVDGAIVEVIDEVIVIDGVEVALDARFPQPFIDGLTPLEEDAEVVPAGVIDDIPIPDMVSNAQARLALLQKNKLDAVAAAIEALPDDMKARAKIKWEFAGTIERDSDIVALMAQALSFSPADLDDLFTLAASL